ncbi:hypothetical protein ACRRTK_016006 [Alexandromys fortis]
MNESVSTSLCQALGHKGRLRCLLFPFLGISFNSCLLLVGPSFDFASLISCPLIFVSQRGRKGLGELVGKVLAI